MAPIVERISDESLELGEGPHWDAEAQALYYVDIFGKTIHKYTPATNTHAKASVGEHVSFIIPVKGKPNQFVISKNREIHLITWDGVRDIISKSEKLAEVDIKPDVVGNRINDAKTDPTGKLWAGTMGQEPVTGQIAPNKGTLYSINSNQVKSHVSNVHISNGLAWSADLKKFYYIDSGEKRVDQFDFDVENEAIENRQPLFSLEKHNLIDIFPDGQTIDAGGNLWVALFNGFGVIKIDSRKPETLLETIKLPAQQVTSVAFGGPNLDELYVTTARLANYGKPLLPPENGALYRIRGLGVKGLPGVPIKL